MEINPSLARLQQLRLQDGVQMQREAVPDDEMAGCPGCPYYWTCPVPHRGQTVTAPAEIDVEDMADQVPPRTAYRPRDVEDIGWSDEWIEVDEPAEDAGDPLDGAGESEADAAADRSAPPRRGRLHRLFRRGRSH